MRHVTKIPCTAVLFDLDGVLVDSMPLIKRILRAWADLRGLDADQAVALSHGRRDIDLVRTIAPHLEAEAEARRIAEWEEQDFAGLRPVPGAPDLLAALPVGGWAVVTSGTRAVAHGRLAAAGLPRPRHLVAADDIQYGKPAPDGYLRAAKLVGVDPRGCVVVEDAEAGVAAAGAAGMRCVALGDGVATKAVGEPAARVMDLREITVLNAEEGIVLAFSTR